MDIPTPQFVIPAKAGIQRGGVGSMTVQEPLTLDKMAMALQWAIYRFMPESERVQIPIHGNMALQLGLTLSSNILLPLTAELALKGLLQKHKGLRGYKHTHDLLKLYQSLPSEVQCRLTGRFRQLIQGPLVSNNSATLEEFLVRHRCDFERWRYLDDDVEDLVAEPLGFHAAICAILDLVYSDHPACEPL